MTDGLSDYGAYWQRRMSTKYFIEYAGKKYKIDDLTLSSRIGKIRDSSEEQKLLENSKVADEFMIKRQEGDDEPVQMDLRSFINHKDPNIIAYLLRNGGLEDFLQK
jgi:hypothetical protein